MSDIKLTLPIRRRAADVFAACTDPAVLTTWFAEFAEVSLADGIYNFWGRHTPGAPKRDEGRHRVVEFEAGSRLAYEWHLRGADTRVEYQILDTPDGSTFHLIHRGLPPLSPRESSIGDFWTHALEGLRRWLEGEQPHDKLDYAAPHQGDISLAVHIAMHPHDVFMGLIDPNQLNRWVARKAVIEPKVGGRIDFGWGQGPVKILELNPDRKLSFSWQWEGEPDTVTTWELEGSQGGTRLTIVQSGFAPGRNSEDYYVGWHKFAYRLKAMLEGGPDWQRAESIQDDVQQPE